MSFVGGYEHVDQMPNHLLPDFSENTRRRARQQPKTEGNCSKVTSMEMRSSQIHKEMDHFPEAPFVSPHLHFSPGDKMTSVHKSFFEWRQGGESEEVKVPIRLSTAFFLSWGLMEARGVCYLKRGS